jgi:hypothetical protein
MSLFGCGSPEQKAPALTLAPAAILLAVVLPRPQLSLPAALEIIRYHQTRNYAASRSHRKQTLRRHLQRGPPPAQNKSLVVVHGVSQNLIDRVFAENVRFHVLPLERKLAVKVNSKGIGYMPPGLQQPKYSQDEPLRKPDIGEAFFIGREAKTKPHEAGTPDPLYQGGNQWPQDLPGFRETLIEYFRRHGSA